MSRGIRVLGLWTSVLLGLAFGAAGAAWAKPADLPIPSQPVCEDGKDGPTYHPPAPSYPDLTELQEDTSDGSIAAKVVTEAPPMIDAVSPAFLSALFDQLFVQIGNAIQPRPVSPEEKAAQEAYRRAEECARTGQLEQARLLFQQTHLLAPLSKVGRQAIDRIQQIEERLRDAAEESTDPPSTAPDPEARFREMRDRTVPLGLVVVWY